MALGVAAIVAFLLPLLARRINRRRTHLLCMLAGGLGLGGGYPVLLQQLPETLDKARGRRPVHDIVVDAQGQVQVLPYPDLALVHARFLGDPAHGDRQREIGHRDPPSPAPAEHPYGRHHHRTGIHLTQETHGTTMITGDNTLCVL